MLITPLLLLSLLLGMDKLKLVLQLVLPFRIVGQLVQLKLDLLVLVLARTIVAKEAYAPTIVL